MCRELRLLAAAAAPLLIVHSSGTPNSDVQQQRCGSECTTCVCCSLPCCSPLATLQVSYVLDTEDVMYRQRSSKPQPDAADASRMDKWHKWLDVRCAAMSAATAATAAVETAAAPASVPVDAA